MEILEFWICIVVMRRWFFKSDLKFFVGREEY